MSRWPKSPAECRMTLGRDGRGLGGTRHLCRRRRHLQRTGLAAQRTDRQHLVPEGGIGAFVQRRLTHGLDIRLHTPVVRVRWGGQGGTVVVETASGLITADACIVTASTGVLASGAAVRGRHCRSGSARRSTLADGLGDEGCPARHRPRSPRPALHCRSTVSWSAKANPSCRSNAGRSGAITCRAGSAARLPGTSHTPARPALGRLRAVLSAARVWQPGRPAVRGRRHAGDPLGRRSVDPRRLLLRRPRIGNGSGYTGRTRGRRPLMFAGEACHVGFAGTTQALGSAVSRRPERRWPRSADKPQAVVRRPRLRCHQGNRRQPAA